MLLLYLKFASETYHSFCDFRDANKRFQVAYILRNLYNSKKLSIKLNKNVKKAYS